MERTPIPADLVEKASAAVKAITAEPEHQNNSMTHMQKLQPIRKNYNPSEKTQLTSADRGEGEEVESDGRQKTSIKKTSRKIQNG
jgi:hypothetical protein